MKLQTYLFSKAENTKSMFWTVFILTICDSIFLFVPPEVFIAPPIIAKKKNALPIVIAASLGSLIGGTIAYLIGAYLYNSVGVWLIDTFASPEKFQMAQAMFAKHGLLIILIAAVTPAPYKLLCICAGFLGFNPVLFLGVCAIFRTGRFATAGFLIWRFQEQASKVAKKYFLPLTLLAILAALAGVFLIL